MVRSLQVSFVLFAHLIVSRALNGSGLAVVGGLCPTVGVVGFTLGGGVSMLSRSWGLAIDNLLGMNR